MAPASGAKKTASAARSTRKPARERVLIEFPVPALRRADEAVRAANVSRSEFVRAAVERQLEALDAVEFERELAEACIANSARNLELLKEFEDVDRESANREASK